MDSGKSSHVEWRAIRTGSGAVLCVRAATHADLARSGLPPLALIAAAADAELPDEAPPGYEDIWDSIKGKDEPGETVDRTDDYRRLAAEVVVGSLDEAGRFEPGGCPDGLEAPDLIGIHLAATAHVDPTRWKFFLGHWSRNLYVLAARTFNVPISRILMGGIEEAALDLAVAHAIHTAEKPAK